MAASIRNMNATVRGGAAYDDLKSRTSGVLVCSSRQRHLYEKECSIGVEYQAATDEAPRIYNTDTTFYVQYDMMTKFAFYGLTSEPVVGTNAIANRAYCGHRTDGTLRFG